MTGKLRTEKWSERPRIEKLANFMYPHLSDASAQRDMLSVMQAQGRGPDLQKRIEAGQKAYRIKPAEPSSGGLKAPMTDDSLSRVPGLIKVRGYRA